MSPGERPGGTDPRVTLSVTHARKCRSYYLEQWHGRETTKGFIYVGSLRKREQWQLPPVPQRGRWRLQTAL